MRYNEIHSISIYAEQSKINYHKLNTWQSAEVVVSSRGGVPQLQGVVHCVLVDLVRHDDQLGMLFHHLPVEEERRGRRGVVERHHHG